MRLHVALANAGLGSRRACERYIAAGRVQLNGAAVTTQGCIVTEHDEILFDGKQIDLPAKKVYLAFHKPTEVICTNSDPHHRTRLIDLLPPHYSMRLFTVGRLDYWSSGLILVTNDGNWAHAIQHPRQEIEKEYMITTSHPVSPRHLNNFIDGIDIENIRYHIIGWEQRSARAISVILHEGKKRELRIVLSYLGYHIRALQRIRIGHITLDNLAVGESRVLDCDEYTRFFPPDR